MKSKIERLGKVSITVEKDYWDINKAYNRLTIVEQQGTSTAFLSRKVVPIGINIADRNYWIKIGKWADIIIDDEPIKESEHLVKSGGVFEAIRKADSVIDISTLTAVDGIPHKYNNLAAALTVANILLSEDQKKGGMSIKFIKTTAATYKVVKLNHVVTGTRIPYPLTLESGTYTAKDIEGVDLPVNVDESVSYYYQEGSNVTSWTITKVTDDINEYKQYRLKATSWSTNIDDWKDTDAPKLRHLTQAEYDALSEEEKMNGAYYFIEE